MITGTVLRSMMAIALLLGFSFGQGTHVNLPPEIQEAGPSRSVPFKTAEHIERERLQKMFELRQMEVRRDTEKMAKLSAELRDALDASNGASSVIRLGEEGRNHRKTGQERKR